MDHPKKKIRDTQKYKPFKKTVKVLVKLTNLVHVYPDPILRISVVYKVIIFFF